ncbi:MAG: transglutaminase family protein [Lewinella sp.]|nr:transglutaminase family protein [Lewinella sp.]
MPYKQFSALDAEGNTAHWVYFEGLAEHLVIDQDLRVESRQYNPFDFLIYPFETVRLPIVYPDQLLQPLSPYFPSHPPKGMVAEWASAIRTEAGSQTLDFLLMVCERLKKEFTYAAREKGPPHPPEETLVARRGSCRDLSWLMVAACQHVGLAARFVSGYAWSTEDISNHDLHAWVEVYLPGAGWRGFDPTLGSPVTANHVALAASVHPQLTAPLSGSYFGGAASELKTSVQLRLLDL